MVNPIADAEFKVGLSDLDEVAKKVLEHGSAHSILTLEGDLGAGKTTLVQAICNHLGVIDSVSSPTFSLINEYALSNGNVIFHIDCYRLNSEREGFEAGITEALDSGHLCLVEWPSKIEGLLPERRLHIEIGHLPDSMRSYNIKSHE